MKNTDLAYIAGLFDADGTIGIKRNTYSMRVLGNSTQPTYSERIHIRQVERGGVDLCAEIFGGNIGITQPSTPSGKPLFNWGKTDMKATQVLRAILPYLRIKRAQALNCLDLRRVKETSKRKRRSHSPRPIAISDVMESLYQKAKELNRVGS